MTISEATRDQMRDLASRYPKSRSALLPMLHLVQSVDNEVTADGINACAEVLGITSAEVTAVASALNVPVSQTKNARPSQ